MNISRPLASLTALLLCIMSTQAQVSTKAIKSREAIERAERNGLPRTRDSLLNTFIKDAITERDIYSYLWGIRTYPERLSLSEFEQLRGIKELQESDKLKMDISLFFTLLKTYQSHQYKIEEGKVQSNYRELNPEKEWTLSTYKHVLDILYTHIWSKPQALLFPWEPHQTALDYVCFEMNKRVSNLSHTALSKHVRQLEQKSIEQYLSNCPQTEQRLSAKWIALQYNLHPEEKTLEHYRALEREHHLSKEMLPLLIPYVGMLDQEGYRQEAYELLQKYLPIASSTEKKEFVALSDKLRSIQLSGSLKYSVIYTGKVQQLEVRGFLLKRAEVRVYRVPMVLNNPLLWRPSKDSRPIYRKELSFPEQNKWLEQTQVIPIEHESYGQYCIELEAKETYTPGLSPKETRPLRANYQITNILPVGESYSGEQSHFSGRRYLNALTGQPLGGLPLQFFRNVNARDDKQTVQQKKVNTNDEGWTKEVWNNYTNQSYVLNEYDPLYSEHRAYSEPLELRDNSEYDLFLMLDRAIYRPGQELHVYGALTELGRFSENSYVLTDKEVQLTLRNTSFKTVKQVQLRSDAYGRFSTKFSLDAALEPGNYYVHGRFVSSAHKEVEEYATFKIAEYKRPQIELLVSPVREALVLGDTVQIPIQVKTYSGFGSEDVEVKARISASRRLYRNRYSSRIIGEETKEYTITTDSTGQATLSLALSDLLGQPNLKAENTVELWYRVHISAIAPTGEVVDRSLSFEASSRKPKLRVVGSNIINRETDSLPWYISVDSIDHKTNARIDYNISKGLRIVQSGTVLDEERIKLDKWLRSAESGIYTLRYKAVIKGEELEGSYPFTIYDIKDKDIQLVEEGLHILGSSDKYQHGKAPELYYATNLPNAYVFYAIDFDSKQIKRGQLRPKAGKIERIPITLPKDTLGTISLKLYTVQKGRIYQDDKTYVRQEANKELQLKWTSFRDRTKAGAEEQWSLQVLHEGKPVKAALISWAYDASLDAISPYNIKLPRLQMYRWLNPSNFNTQELLAQYSLGMNESLESMMHQLMDARLSYAGTLNEKVVVRGGPVMRSIARTSMPAEAKVGSNGNEDNNDDGNKANEGVTRDRASSGLRQNFNELAYIRPTLETDKEGNVSWSFRMPDALTRWRVMTIAHTPDLRIAVDNRDIETYRDVQVEPYLPRFVRLGDSLNIRSLVRNTSDKAIEGQLRLEVFSPRTKEILLDKEYRFNLNKSKSETFAFALDGNICKGLDSVGIRLRATSDSFGDGEEHLLPVIPASSEVVRSEAITLFDTKSESYDLGRSLFPSNGFIPEQGSLHIRIESNPMYLALLALPSLSYFESENSANYATALYALSLSQHISQTPGLDRWLTEREQAIGQGLHGDREKLLNNNITKHPWVNQLAQEQERQALLRFKRLLKTDEVEQLERKYLQKLKTLQNEQGGFSWYPGMPTSRYMTLYVTKLLYRRGQVQGKAFKQAEQELLNKAWDYLHTSFRNEIKAIRNKKERAYLSHGALDYLYLLSLDATQAQKAEDNITYLEALLRPKVYKLAHEDKAMAALIYAKRNPQLASNLLESLRQHLTTDKQGTYYSSTEQANYWWYNRSYEAITMTIELMERLSAKQDAKLIQGMKRWLLAQKRTTEWSNPIATAEVVYALSRDKNFEHEDATNRTAISLRLSDGSLIKQSAQEQQGLDLAFTHNKYPQTLTLSTEKTGTEVWASATARYTLPIKEDTPSGRELRTEREYFVQRVVDGETKLLALRDGEQLRIGDLLTTRISITLDRHLDFVAVTDPRLGCTEPIQQLAGYRWGAGTGYYIEPRDKSTTFYIHSLSAGTYTLEYTQRVVRPGSYQALATQTQSIYAPEYTSSTGYTGILSISE